MGILYGTILGWEKRQITGTSHDETAAKLPAETKSASPWYSITAAGNIYVHLYFWCEMLPIVCDT